MGKSNTSVSKYKREGGGTLGFDDFMKDQEEEFINIHTLEEGDAKFFKTSDQIKR